MPDDLPRHSGSLGQGIPWGICILLLKLDAAARAVLRSGFLQKLFIEGNGSGCSGMLCIRS